MSLMNIHKIHFPGEKEKMSTFGLKMNLIWSYEAMHDDELGFNIQRLCAMKRHHELNFASSRIRIWDLVIQSWGH